MTYDLFLFDLDDTLLDFGASERLSFITTLHAVGINDGLDELYRHYKTINTWLWHELDHGRITLHELKVKRFEELLIAHAIAIDPALVSIQYLENLPLSVVLIDHAKETCEWLSQHGEIGIITNGFHHVQTRRIANSALAPYISFMGVSDVCGFSKPDPRFFEHTTQMAKKFAKASTVIIGDRIEADMLGAQQFGIDGCWFNPSSMVKPEHITPRYEIRHLSELRTIV